MDELAIDVEDRVLSFRGMHQVGIPYLLVNILGHFLTSLSSVFLEGGLGETSFFAKRSFPQEFL
jgi:hypothetical protein